ncbi:MAG: hypothetical protein J3R72DRAFT_429254 [Linnemannia gamsii]|nr:MAG: hypothetical protein J3R72DRAFT_429254 [Linnemannia gamsii]
MQGSTHPYKHLLWIRIILGIMAVTNLAILFSTMPIFTHQQINYSEFLDLHQFSLNILVFIACMNVFCGCHRFPSWIRLISGCLLVGANLAYPIGIFVKINRHNVGYGAGCNGYIRDRDGEETTFLKTRCYMQYMIGSLNVLMALLVAAEVGLSWRMSRDQEYLDMVEKERLEMELKEMQRRERAMTVHHYQPNLALQHEDEDDLHRTPRGSLGDVLPEYQQRETTVGLGRLVDMGHVVNGEAEEVCPHPYVEEEEEREESGYMDPSPFSELDIEAQAGRPMPSSSSAVEEERSRSLMLGVTSGSRLGESEAVDMTAVIVDVVVPMGQPPIYAP